MTVRERRLISNTFYNELSSKVYKLSPTLSKQSMRAAPSSPVCEPGFHGKTNINRLYFAHTRKAGGSHLRNYLEKFAVQNNWEFFHIEAEQTEDPIRQDTLYVTMIRDPVQRVISNYKYEGRWNRHSMGDQFDNKSAVMSYDNEHTLEKYIQLAQTESEPLMCRRDIQISGLRPGRSPVWTCVRDCYMRWYGQDFNCLENRTLQYDSALSRLSHYDIIVVAERLRDPDYVRNIQAMFGNFMPGYLFKQHDAWLGKKIAQWNTKYPPTISNETVGKLRTMNAQDTKIYEFLNDCPNGINFPDPNQTQFPFVMNG